MKLAKMRKMSGILGLTLLVLLLSPATSEALWPEKKPATAGEVAKEYAKEANQATTDAASNVGGYVDDTLSTTRERAADAAGAVKDAASRGAQTVTGGRQDHGSTGATGAAYRDATGRYVADSVSATQGKAAHAAEVVKDTVAKATQTVADTTRAAGEKASEAATATKDAAVDTAQAARDKAAQSYDASAETLGATSNKAADTLGSTRDRVWGTPESEKTYTQRAQDHTSYAGEKLSESAQAAADAAQRAGQNVRDSAARAYDSTTNTLGTPVKDQAWGKGNEDRGIMDKAGDYYQSAKDSASDAAYRTGDAVSNAAGATKDAASRTGEATRDTAYRTMGYEAPFDKGYASEAYNSARDASSSAYETGRNKLGNIIEILGWHRLTEDEHTKNSPYDVLVGNTRYVWHQRPDSEDSYYQKAKDTFGGATETTSDKASQAKNAAYDSAGRTTENVKSFTARARDAVVDTANRVSESVKEKTGQSGKTAGGYSQRGKEALGAGAAAIGAHKLVETPKNERVSRLLRFVHLLAYAVTFGSAVWMTFISGRILSRTIPREQFRAVQTRMFPYFLKFMVVGEAALAVLSNLTSSSSSKWPLLGFLFLIAATAFNAFVLEPKTTKIYLERVRTEKEEGRGVDAAGLSEKQQKFNEVHGLSALLNLLSLAGLTLHGWNMVPSLSA